MASSRTIHYPSAADEEGNYFITSANLEDQSDDDNLWELGSGYSVSVASSDEDIIDQHRDYQKGERIKWVESLGETFNELETLDPFIQLFSSEDCDSRFTKYNEVERHMASAMWELRETFPKILFTPTDYNPEDESVEQYLKRVNKYTRGHLKQWKLTDQKLSNQLERPDGSAHSASSFRRLMKNIWTVCKGDPSIKTKKKISKQVGRPRDLSEDTMKQIATVFTDTIPRRCPTSWVLSGPDHYERGGGISYSHF